MNEKILADIRNKLTAPAGEGGTGAERIPRTGRGRTGSGRCVVAGRKAEKR